MFIVILMVVVFVVALFVINRVLPQGDPRDAGPRAFMLTLLSGSATLLVLVPSMLYSTAHTSGGYTNKQDLVAMKDNTGAVGTFFLGTGSVDSKTTYNFYVKQGDGIVLKTVDSKDAIIIEQEGTPLVQTIDDECRDSLLCLPGTFHTQYEFYVPKGSVNNDFKMDGQ